VPDRWRAAAPSRTRPPRCEKSTSSSGTDAGGSHTASTARPAAFRVPASSRRSPPRELPTRRSVQPSGLLARRKRYATCTRETGHRGRLRAACRRGRVRVRPLERGGRLAHHDQDDLDGLGDLARPVGGPGFRAGHRPHPATASPLPTPPPAPGASPPPAAGPLPVPAVTHPGVIADCTSAPPHRLSIRPATIVLACADDGLGVQKLAWTT
jgi:hypothetical protein